MPIIKFLKKTPKGQKGQSKEKKTFDDYIRKREAIIYLNNTEIINSETERREKMWGYK